MIIVSQTKYIESELITNESQVTEYLSQLSLTV